MVASVERYQRSVVTGETRSPALLIVTDSMKVAEVSGLVSSAVGVPTSRSGPTMGGVVADTVTATAVEQLLFLLLSPATTSTHAP